MRDRWGYRQRTPRGAWRCYVFGCMQVKDALPNLPSLPNLSGNPVEKAADKVLHFGGFDHNDCCWTDIHIPISRNVRVSRSSEKGNWKEAFPGVLNGHLMCAYVNWTQVQSDVGTAANKAKNVASDISDLPNPFKGNADPQNLAKDAKNAVRIIPC